MEDPGVFERKNILKSARRSELTRRCFLVAKGKAHKKTALKERAGVKIDSEPEVGPELYLK